VGHANGFPASRCWPSVYLCDQTGPTGMNVNDLVFILPYSETVYASQVSR
jgi:hypothetical protein